MSRYAKHFSVAILILASFGGAIAQNKTHVGQAVNEAAQSSGHASGSAAHSIAASGQVTSAVLAVPLSVGGVVLGSAGAASAVTARESMRAANAPIGTPLNVTDEVITVIPPNQALKAKDGAEKR